jgi:general secretion pathway protein K
MNSDADPARFDPSRQRGFILVTVLWLVALFALAVAVFSKAVTSEIRVTTNIAGAAAAEALADAGASLAILDLVSEFNERAPARFPRNGASALPCTLDGGLVRIAIQDTAGRVDLNRASAVLLAALFAGHGVDALSARQLAARTIDYRDRDDVTLDDGAEREDYAAGGAPAPPRNAPFDTVDEVGRVLGLPVWLIARLAPDVTLASGQAGIDPTVASRPLLTRLSAGAAQLGLGAGFSGDLPTDFIVRSPRRSFVVMATGETAEGSRFVREAVVEVGQRRGRGYALRSWRRGEGATPIAPSIGLPPPAC